MTGIAADGAGTEFMPYDHIRQGVVRFACFQKLLGGVRAPGTVTRTCDQSMVGGWFDTVGIGFLTILILVPYLLDDAVGLIPVLQELSIILCTGVVPVSVPIRMVRLVKRHEYDFVRMLGVGENFVHHHFKHFIKIPSAVSGFRIGAVIRSIDVPVQFVGSGVSWTLAAGVWPIRIPILEIDHQFLTTIGEELVFDGEHIGTRMLQTAWRLLRSDVYPRTVDDRIRRRSIIANAIQHSRSSAVEIAGFSAVIHIQRLYGFALISDSSCCRRSQRQKHGGHGNNTNRRPS